MGRPTDYRQETADAICERLANGESLRAICRDDAMPALSAGFNDRPTEASRPFDSKRDGFVIAGGGGVVVMEELEHAFESR